MGHQPQAPSWWLGIREWGDTGVAVTANSLARDAGLCTDATQGKEAPRYASASCLHIMLASVSIVGPDSSRP